MAQTCTICRSENRREIDEALLRNEPHRLLSARTGVSASALSRHKLRHIPATLAVAKAAQDVEYAGSVFERLKAINRETAAILAEARAAETPVIALMAVGRIEKQLELEAKLLGQLDDSVKISLGVAVNAPDARALGKVRDALSRATPEQLDAFTSLLDQMGSVVAAPESR